MALDNLFVCVPENTDAIWGWLRGDFSHVTAFRFTEEEIEFLLPFFDRLAKRFHKDFIDYYEEEHLEPELLDETLAMTEKFVSEHEGCEFSCAMHRFLAAVKLAKKNDVWLCFNL